MACSKMQKPNLTHIYTKKTKDVMPHHPIQKNNNNRQIPLKISGLKM